MRFRSRALEEARSDGLQDCAVAPSPIDRVSSHVGETPPLFCITPKLPQRREREGERIAPLCLMFSLGGRLPLSLSPQALTFFCCCSCCCGGKVITANLRCLPVVQSLSHREEASGCAASDQSPKDPLMLGSWDPENGFLTSG